MNSIHSILISSLSTLPSATLSGLILALSAASHHHLCRLSTLLSSPFLFSLTLRRLRSLSLHHKSLLIARHLLSALALILQHFPQDTPTTAPPSFSAAKLRDLDSALLLILLCEIHRHDRRLLDAPPSRWRVVLCDYLISDSILRVSNLGGCSGGDVLVRCVESIGQCWSLVGAFGVGCCEEVAASAAAVVALPSVKAGGGMECAICTEEMREGGEVCELPCRHLFHWRCVLRWLRRRDTCPCCRRRLPADDVRREIERLLEDLARMGGGGIFDGE